jgi:hypothetical protein
MTIMDASPPRGAKDGESTIMDGSWAEAMSAEASVGGAGAGLGLKGAAVGAGAGLRSTTVALVGGLLGGNAPPSRGPSSLVRVGGGTARASLNLELF